MAMSIRFGAMNLSKVSITRVPLVALVNSHTVSMSLINNPHHSNYSTKSPRNEKLSSWAETAMKAANDLENSAHKIAGTVEKATKEYLHEVKRYSSEEDEILKDMGVAMSGGKKKGASQGSVKSPTTFEQTFSDQVHVHVNPTKTNHSIQHHNEMVASLLNEFKSEDSESSLSPYASNAIQMAESQNVLKHDRAPINDVGKVDPATKFIHSHR
ncbi:hypothetical protein BGZ76_004876 [Entomortierella beljakovae]|nr:hypothetical protein BGZ76_004876 [Entomortierella beljakovae]